MAADEGGSILCTRIGLVTGQGLARNFEQRFPDWLSGIFVMDRHGDHHSGDVRRWLTFTHLVQPQKRPHRVQRYIESEIEGHSSIGPAIYTVSRTSDQE